MFCPNCGTKNPDSEAKCGQCGFDLQAKAPQARFKGTMVMAPTAAAPKPAAGTAAPSAQGPSPQGPSASKAGSLKGTMIGVAPPEMARALEEAKAAKAAAQAAAAPSAAAAPPPAVQPPATGPPAAAATKSSLKGTMIGVAPPDMQAAIAAARAKIAGSDAGPPAATATPPAAERPPAAGPAPTAKPNIKGTMIGVAPPDVGAAIAAHKAELEKRSTAQALTDPAPPDAAQPKTTSPLARAPNSKLKGTMMGVAPPDVSQAITQAKAQASPGSPATSPAASPAVPPARTEEPPPPAAHARKTDLGATMVGTAEPVRESLRPAATANRSPSGQFRGTMVGATSPLVESNDRGDSEPGHDIPEGPDSRAAGNSDHPAAFASTSLSAAAEIVAARANLQRVLADSEPPPAPRHPTGRDIPTGAQSPAALRSAAQTSKKNALPILLLGLALVIVAALIAFALLKRSKAAEPDPAPVVQPAAAPAPAGPAPH